MALGIGLFRTEGRSKGVHLAEGHRHAFGLQLAGNRQRCVLLEEVLAVVNSAILCTGQILWVQCRDGKHLACPFAVAPGDERRVGIDKAIFIEEFVNRIGRCTAHTECRAERIGARAQMCDGTQIFHGVTLLLQRIIRRRGPLHDNLRGMNFKGLLCLRRQEQFSCDNNGRTNIQLCNVLIIGQLIRLKNDLHALKAASIV